MRTPIEFLSYEQAAHIWSYEPNTGLLRLRSTGEVVGGGNAVAESYRLVMWRGRSIKVHRLAWLLTHGQWPEYVIDHINGMRSDNRICNLRDVPHAINQRNQNYHRAGLTRLQFAASRGPQVRRYFFNAEPEA